jgi:hypothetical protein
MVTKRNSGRKSSKPKELYQKFVTISLVGGKKEDLTEAAHEIHKHVSKKTAGGMLNREVQVTHESTKPKKIWLGRI